MSAIKKDMESVSYVNFKQLNFSVSSVSTHYLSPVACDKPVVFKAKTTKQLCSEWFTLDVLNS